MSRLLIGVLGFVLGLAAMDAAQDMAITALARVQQFAVTYQVQLICAHYKATGRPQRCRTVRT